MSLLHASGLAYGHPAQNSPLFTEVAFDLRPGDRVALVGPNGTGKTSLLRLMTGELTPSEGAIARRPGLQVASLSQVCLAPPDMLLLDHVLASRPELASLRERIRHLETRLDEPEQALAYADALADYEAADGYALEAEAERILAGLGLADLQQPMRELSGGQRTLAGLARVLMSSAELLLLDEPTNHLDLGARAWLVDYLQALDAAFLVVSHDRRFLEAVARRTFELRNGTLSVFEGDYAFYREARALRERQAWERYEGEMRRRAAEERAARERMRLAQQVAKAPPEARLSKDFYGAKAARIARTASILRARSERRDAPSKPRIEAPIPTLTFPNVTPSGEVVFRVEGMSKTFGDAPLIQDLDWSILRGERWAVTGGNGSGKSTLLKLLLGQVAPDAGTVERGAGVRIGYFAQEGENLDLERSPLDLCLEVYPDRSWVRTLLACMRVGASHVERPIGTMSAGERGKVAIARLLLSGANVLLMDEPTNHLDLDAREALEETLSQYPGTLIVISHDPAFVEALAERELALGES